MGASLAGVRAVEAARRSGYEGMITLVGAEEELPYDRPPLSKNFLTEELAQPPTHFVDEHGLRNALRVDLRLSTSATGVDASARMVHTAHGDIEYSTLIIATGSSPSRPPVGRTIAGIHVLRTLSDAHWLRHGLRRARRIVIVGAGFIGAEVATAAQTLGLDVTLVDAHMAPLERAFGTEVSSRLAQLHVRHGVDLRVGTEVVRVLGDEKVEAVTLTDGEVLEADLVVVGVGSKPATRWLRGSGVDLDDLDGAVVCDAYLQSSIADVYAAGDVASWPNALCDARVRQENWTNAAEQGARAAINALFPDRRAPYEAVPYFWSDWYGQRIQFVGTTQSDRVEVIETDGSGRFVAFFGRGDRLVGAATLNHQRTVMKLRRHIQARGTWADALSILAAGVPAGTSDGRHQSQMPVLTTIAE